MLKFEDLKIAVQKQFEKMVGLDLYVTDVDKDVLWQTYLNSYREGTNNIFRVRREHDCQCCRQFIRNCGNVVALKNNKLVSIWDIKIGGHYQVVADILSKLVKSKLIKDIFLNKEKHVGTDSNRQLLENEETITWKHFYLKVPAQYVLGNGNTIGTVLSKNRSNKEVLKRGLSEIIIESVETVLELVEQKSIYRGEEHKPAVDSFLKLKKKFDVLKTSKEKDNYCWLNSTNPGIKNTVIGTLLVDISEGMNLDDAVRMFESKVAPTNYKRPTAVISKRMIELAQKEIGELGYVDSTPRRHANIDDITINNVLFADRSIKKTMNVFDELVKDVPTDIKKLKKVEEVSIDTFINTILPKVSSVEVMFENRHINNLMSLIAPKIENAKNMFKWDNNFSWAYQGEVADSMKERVKKEGGNVDGVLRFSIQWNDGDNNQNDFDAHCKEPDGNHIYFRNKTKVHPSSGELDVDIQSPGKKVAVENIVWTDKKKMQEKVYTFFVHNYSHNGGKTGFTAEIEYEGCIYTYSYAKELRHGEQVIVAKIDFSRKEGIKFIKSLPSTQASKEVWGIPTHKFHKVSVIMNSPNYWDDKTTGNKHYFFMLQDCINDKPARGFFNEFLKEDLREHRKVFEVLGSKMKTEESSNQLSGLGFSTTKRNSIFCKVTGNFTRTLKINF